MTNNTNPYKIHTGKCIIPILFILLFAYGHNTAIAQDPTSEKVIIGQNVLKFVVTKNTRDRQLELIKEKLYEKKVSIDFSNVERNEKREITGIGIDYGHDGKKGNYFVRSGDPIADIAISYNVHENTLSVGRAAAQLSQSFEVNKENGASTINKPTTESSVLVYTTNEADKADEKTTVTGKDGNQHTVKKDKKTYVIKSETSKESSLGNENVLIKQEKNDTIWIKQNVKKIIWTDDEGNNIEIINAEENGRKHIRVFNDKAEKPLILLDGIEIDKKNIGDIDPNDIENMNVLKDKEAIAKYGEKAKHGVIIITTKKKE